MRTPRPYRLCSFGCLERATPGSSRRLIRGSHPFPAAPMGSCAHIRASDCTCGAVRIPHALVEGKSRGCARRKRAMQGRVNDVQHDPVIQPEEEEPMPIATREAGIVWEGALTSGSG